MKVKGFLFDKYSVILEIKFSGVAELRYKMLYGKSQINQRGSYV